jgi:aconitase B
MGVVDAASVDAASAPMADARLADAPEACGELPLPHLLEVMSLMRDPEPQGSVETIEITVRLVDSFVVAAGVVSVKYPFGVHVPKDSGPLIFAVVQDVPESPLAPVSGTFTPAVSLTTMRSAFDAALATPVL